MMGRKVRVTKGTRRRRMTDCLEGDCGLWIVDSTNDM